MGVTKRGAALIRTLVGNSLATGQSYLAEVQARADIERARQELRLGNVARTELLLAGSVRPFLSAAPEAGPAPGVTGAVSLTLRGQCERLRQLPGEGSRLFDLAVRGFARASDHQLSPGDHGDFGMALTARARYEEARPHLEAAVLAADAPPEHVRELARVYLEAGQASRAGSLIEQALLTQPLDPDVYLLRARAQQARGKPAPAGTYLRAGELLASAGRSRDALEAFEQAEKLSPGLVTGLRAQALHALGRDREALNAFDAALKAAKDASAWLLIRRALTKLALGNQRGASADVKRALDLAPEDGEVLVLAGQVRLGQEDQAATVELAKRALEREPGNWQAAVLGARAYWSRGDLGSALELARSAGADGPHHPELLTLRADLALAAGRPAEAIEQLERLQDTPLADARDASRYAAVLLDNRRADDAGDVVTRGLSVWPDDLDLRIVEARLLTARGDREAGRTRAIELAAQAPGSAAAQLLEATMVLEAGPPWDEATRADVLAAAERASALDPQSAEPWWIRALVQQDEGDLAGARAALAEVLSRDARHRLALRLAVELEIQKGDLSRAEEFARALVATNPDDVDSLAALAQVLIEEQRYNEALALLHDPRVEVSGVPAQRADRLFTRAGAESELGKLSDAARDLETASGLAGDRVDIWIARASVARQLGDAESAERYVGQALANDPANFDARTELAAAYLMKAAFGQARPLLEALEREKPDDVRVGLLHVQAIAAYAPDQTRPELDRLADEHPGDLSIMYARARFELDAGEYAAALALLDPLPDGKWRADFLALRAEAHRLRAEPDQAIRDADDCLEREPENEEALATLGLTLLETGQGEQAVEVFERARASYPASPLVQARLGQGYAAVDRYADALSLLDSAVLSAPDNAWVIARLADALSDTGRWAASATLYQQVVARNPHDAAAWNGLGWSLENLENPELRQAEDAYRRAFTLDREPWTQQNLANVLFTRGERALSRQITERVLVEALGRRSEHVGYLGLAGWCNYRLGDLKLAARQLYEATSTQQRTEGYHFDLALVHACDQRIARAAGLYESIIPLLDRDEQRRRGLLLIARGDLRQARDEYPHLAASPEIDGVLAQMTRALAALPGPPTIRALTKFQPVE